MRIVIFNVKYSPNLGDGVIAECLENELALRLTEAEIKSIDLAGRTHWAMPDSGKARLAQLGILQRMPRWLRDLVVEGVLRLRLAMRNIRNWRCELRGADAAVFGGGQLIQDGDLNFPVKLAAAAAQCARFAIPMAVFAVGATPSRSGRGARLLSSLLQARLLVYASARDEQSAQELRARGLTHVDVTPDPGLLAAWIWPVAARSRRSRPVIGVGITHPAVLRHHGESMSNCTDEATLERYDALVGNLLAAGYDVTCFSNGAHEDEACIATAAVRFRQLDPSGLRLRIARRCGRPRELAELIAGFDGIVAHRLHACILAYSYRVPHVGLAWDAKLTSFFSGVQRAGYVVPFDHSSVVLIPSLLAKAMAERVDEQTHARVLDQASASIDQLTCAIVGGIRSQCIRSLPARRSLVLPRPSADAWV